MGADENEATALGTEHDQGHPGWQEKCCLWGSLSMPLWFLVPPGDGTHMAPGLRHPNLAACCQQRQLLLWQVALSQALLPCRFGWICGSYAGYERH